MRAKIVPYYIWYGILRDETCSNLDGDQKPNENTNPVTSERKESEEKVPDNFVLEADPWLGQSQGNKQGLAMSAWIKLGAALRDIERTVKMPMVAPRLRFAPP